jgi:tripartite-type tricarboxylate transporter receptor subunit TctC
MKLIAAVLLALAAPGAAAQAWPVKPVRIVVPFPPGGTADLLSRLTAEKLGASFGQQFVVENRAGAGGNLGAEFVARAEPDGHTLLSSPPHLLTINHLLYKLAFDPARFVPVSIIAAYPNVLLSGPKLRVTSLQELFAQARERPGKLNIASQGNGTSSHLSAELLKSMAGIDLLHVPYKGTAPAMTDLLGGQVDCLFDNLITAMPHVKSGKLKLLGVGGARRVGAFPEVPAIAELLPGFRSETWMAIVAPPGTPAPIAAKLSGAIARAVQEPDFRRMLSELQAEPVGNTPREMAEVVRQDTERWTEVIRSARITVQ